MKSTRENTFYGETDYYSKIVVVTMLRWGIPHGLSLGETMRRLRARRKVSEKMGMLQTTCRINEAMISLREEIQKETEE